MNAETIMDLLIYFLNVDSSLAQLGKECSHVVKLAFKHIRHSDKHQREKIRS